MRFQLSILILVIWTGCQKPSSNSSDKQLTIDTLKVITTAASEESTLKRKVPTLIVGEPGKKQTFQVNQPSRIPIRTAQLREYPLFIDNIKNANIDTSEISDFYLTITPIDTTFQFDIFRDYSSRNVMMSFTDYDSLTDDVTTVYSLLNNDRTLVAKINLAAER